MKLLCGTAEYLQKLIYLIAAGRKRPAHKASWCKVAMARSLSRIRMSQQTNTGSDYRVALVLDLSGDGILEESSRIRFQPLNFFLRSFLENGCIKLIELIL